MRLLTQLSKEITSVVESALESTVVIAAYGRKSGGLGAGIVIRSDGVIATNYHVISGCPELKVVVSGRGTFEPEICGVDPISDIAVLKIHARNLVPVKVRPRRYARLGELVFAIGHPEEFIGTVTMGIISSPYRFGLVHPSGRPSVHIQIDAAINPGSSGGPVVGSDGAVLGIPAFGYRGDGLNFAIPINSVIKISRKILKDGSVSYGDLGISGEEGGLPAEAALDHGLRQATAFLVTSIRRDGPAFKARIKRNDWILSIDNKATDSEEQFYDLIDGRIGKRASVKILRSDSTLAVKQVEIGKLKARL